MRDLVKVWRRNGFTLRLWDTGTRDSYGKTRLDYELKDGRAVIFADGDFCCSPMDAIDSPACVGALLGFLTLQEHDTDAEYFERYTPEQLAWRDSSRCHTLCMIQFEIQERCEARKAGK